MAAEYNKKCYESAIMPSDVSHNCALWEYDQTSPYVTTYFVRQVVYYTGPIATYFLASKTSGYLNYINAGANFLGLNIASFTFQYIAPVLTMNQNVFLKANDGAYSIFGQDEIWENIKILNNFLEYLFMGHKVSEQFENNIFNVFASGATSHNNEDESK